MQSCLAEESMRKIPWRNGEEMEKMEEILAVFPSCLDHLELHPIKHSQKNFRQECIFKYWSLQDLLCGHAYQAL